MNLRWYSKPPGPLFLELFVAETIPQKKCLSTLRLLCSTSPLSKEESSTPGSSKLINHQGFPTPLSRVTCEQVGGAVVAKQVSKTEEMLHTAPRVQRRSMSSHKLHHCLRSPALQEGCEDDWKEADSSIKSANKPQVRQNLAELRMS